MNESELKGKICKAINDLVGKTVVTPSDINVDSDMNKTVTKWQDRFQEAMNEIDEIYLRANEERHQ